MNLDSIVRQFRAQLDKVAFDPADALRLAMLGVKQLCMVIIRPVAERRRYKPWYAPIVVDAQVEMENLSRHPHNAASEKYLSEYALPARYRSIEAANTDTESAT